MAIGEGFVGLARRAKQLFKLRAEEGANHGRAALPRVVDLFLVVPEEAQLEGEAPIVIERHDLSQLVQKSRLPIGRQPHDLVLVTVVGKAQILGHRLVEDAKRVRKVDPPFDVDRVVATHAPSGTGEIAKTVDGHNRGLAEGRDEKARSQVGEVVLDPMQLPFERGGRERARKLGFHRSALGLVADAIDDEPDIRPAAQRIADLLQETRPRIGVDGYVVDIGEGDAPLLEAKSDRLGRESGPMLHTPEALLLGGSNNLAVPHKAGGRVTMIRVEAENDHCTGSLFVTAGDPSSSRQARKSPTDGLFNSKNAEEHLPHKVLQSKDGLSAGRSILLARNVVKRGEMLNRPGLFLDHQLQEPSSTKSTFAAKAKYAHTTEVAEERTLAAS